MSSGNVVELVRSNPLAVTPEQLAARLHELADQLAAGAFGDVDNAMVLLYCPTEETELNCAIYGRPMNLMSALGLLEMAKLDLAFPKGDNDEDAS